MLAHLMEDNDITRFGAQRNGRQLRLRDTPAVLVRLVVRRQVGLQSVVEAIGVAISPAVAAWDHPLHGNRSATRVSDDAL